MVQSKFRGVGLRQRAGLAVFLGLCLGLFSYVSLTQAEVVGEESFVYLWQQEENSTTTVRIDRPFSQLVDLSGLTTTASATLAFDFDSRELDGASGTTTPADYAEIGVIINGERIVLSEIVGLPGNHIDEQSSFEKELPKTLTNTDEVEIFAEVFANATTSDRVFLTNTRMFVSGGVENNNGDEESDGEEIVDNEEDNNENEEEVFEENGDENEGDENQEDNENGETEDEENDTSGDDVDEENGDTEGNEEENTDDGDQNEAEENDETNGDNDEDENTNDEGNIDEEEDDNAGEEAEQTEVELFATSSRTVTPSKPLSEVIDLSALVGEKVITLAFDFDTSELDASPKDLLEIGVIINGEKEVLQVIEGLANTNNPLEYGSTSTTSAKLVSNTDTLELYATVLANTESDKAVLTNIVLTAKAQNSADEENEENEEDEDNGNGGNENGEDEGNDNENEEENGNENEGVEDDNEEDEDNNENGETEDEEENTNEEDDNVEEGDIDEEENGGSQSSYVIKIGVNPRTSAAYQASILAPRLGSSNAFSEAELRELYKARF